MARPPDPPNPTLDAWRRHVATRDPVQVCHWFVSQELATRVLPAFPEPEANYHGHARALTRPLVQKALAKLATLFPANAKRGVEALIRARKDAAYKVCAEAVEWAAAEYADDALTHPDDPLAERVRRLDIIVGESLTELPSWQGKPANRVGETGDYALLFADEDWMAAVTRLFPEREWAETDSDRPDWRYIRLHEAQADGQLPWTVPAEVLRIASEASTREEAVLLILSRTAPLARGRAPASLTRRLKRARRQLAARFSRPDAPDSPSDRR